MEACKYENVRSINKISCPVLIFLLFVAQMLT